jgi:hypothetical protein
VNQRVILSFAVAGPDDIRRVKAFLDDTHDGDFEERVQVDFGSLYGRPLRLVKKPSRGEGYFVDASVGGVTGGDDGVYFFLNDDLVRDVRAAVDEVLAALTRAGSNA